MTHAITKYTRAKMFSQVGKKTELFARFTTVAGERGTADAERHIRNSLKADPAYGKGVADALGITLSDVPEDVGSAGR